MPEELLDRDQVHAPLVLVRRARPAQRVRSEPLVPAHALKIEKAGQTVPDRPRLQGLAVIVAEQRRGGRE